MRASMLIPAILLTAVVPCGAVPQLQLDIVGGTYDDATESILGPGGQQTTLVALLTPQGNPSQDDINALLGETYYVSVALLPAVSESTDLGSFTYKNTTDPDSESSETSVSATGDMVYGVPPVEPPGGDQGHDSKDLDHSVFPNYFFQFDFMFDPMYTTASYDTMTSPGGFDSETPGGSFYQTFLFDTSGLAPGYELHFDLYDTTVATAPLAANNNTVPDIDVDDFAPFSHDATTHRTSLPEPGTLLLLGAALLSLAARTKRK